MKTKILTLCLVLSCLIEVHAEDEQEVKRALFPFMAFLYYPDESVVDGSGARFLRGAVLIQPNWLITSAVGPSVLTSSQNGFPGKTLLARAGAISIDSNFTLNEDEDEQEREVIRIVRPYNHSATQWWHTDISLMKTLLPFNLTSAVAATMLVNKLEYVEKTCTILVYAKKDGNWTEERNLMQLTVELLPLSVANCGPHFIGKTMTCAADSDESKNAVYDPNFCQGNSGGPLICEGDVIGIQTYIDNNCKQPHLYQLLSAWDNFITCGTEDKCHEEQCSKICDVANKDPPELDTGDLSTAINTNLAKVSEMVTTYGTYDTTLEVESQPSSSTATHDDQSSADHTPVEQLSTTGGVITHHHPATESRASIKDEMAETKPWPKKKYSDNRKSLDEGDLEDTNRKTKVEAQQQDVKAKHRSAGQTIDLHQSIFIGYFILACLILNKY